MSMSNVTTMVLLWPWRKKVRGSRSREWSISITLFSLDYVHFFLSPLLPLRLLLFYTVYVTIVEIVNLMCIRFNFRSSSSLDGPIYMNEHHFIDKIDFTHTIRTISNCCKRFLNAHTRSKFIKTSSFFWCTQVKYVNGNVEKSLNIVPMNTCYWMRQNISVNTHSFLTVLRFQLDKIKKVWWCQVKNAIFIYFESVLERNL